MEELKPCPHCGGRAVLIATSMCSGYVQCIDDCQISTGKFWDSPMNYAKGERKPWKERATEAWNRRCEPKQELEFDYGSED